MSVAVPTQTGRPVLHAFNVVAGGFLIACVCLVLSHPGMLGDLVQIRSVEQAALYIERVAQLLTSLSTSVAVLAVTALGFWIWLTARYRGDVTFVASAPEPVGLTSASMRRVGPTDNELAIRGQVQADLDIALEEVSRLRAMVGTRDRELAEALKSQSRFLSRVSHDLRTPLNGIIGMSDMLLDSEITNDQKRCVSSILTSAGGLVSEVDSLIDFARFESNELRLERSRFDLSQSVHDVCTAAQPTAHARGLELVFYADDDLPSVVDGDGKRLRQIVRTLVDNAIRHTAEGEVVVRVTRLDSKDERTRYRIDVQDSGAGISPEDQLGLWKAFSSGDAGDGTKLGPSMRVASALVRLMDGKFLIKSRLGEGTRMSAEIMLGDVAGGHESTVPEQSLHGIKALIVDDNQTNLTVLEHQLKRWSIEVTCASSGAEAMSLLRNRDSAFTIGIFDLNMPEMDGLELAREINTGPLAVKLPILMLTSSEIDLETDDLDSIGVQRNLSKPPKGSDLRDTLAAMVVPTADIVPLRAPAEPVSSTDLGDLDATALDAIRKRQRPGKPDVVARAVSAWLNSSSELVGSLEQAVLDNDQAGLLRGVSSLATSSDFVGARNVSLMCRTLENHVRSRDDAAAPLSDDAAVASGIVSVAEACGSVKPVFEELVASAA